LDSRAGATSISMNIVFIGPPASGKGTQCKRLVEHLGIVHLSTGEMLRAARKNGTSLGRLAGAYMDSGNLVPDPLVVSIVGERIESAECANGCLFDGFPRTLGQAASLDRYLEGHGKPLELVIHLRVDHQELITRALGRAQIEGRVDDTLETIEKRLAVFHRDTKPLVEYYGTKGVLESVDGMRSTDEVFAAICAAIDRCQEDS